MNHIYFKLLKNFKKRKIQVFASFVLVLFSIQSKAQTNVGPLAVSNHSGGGASASGYGPELYNDNVIMAYGLGLTYDWGWVTSNGWIEYTWTNTQTIKKIVFYNDNRPFSSLSIEYWNGSAYVTALASLTGSATDKDSITLATPITTTKLRFNNIAGSNPNFREIQTFAGAPAFNDAGVVSIDSPATFCGGVQNIKATIKNFGRNQINPVTVNWSLNGVIQTSYNYTSILDTIGKPGNTAQIYLGSYTFPVTPATVIKVWTSAPNGGVDTVVNNDSAKVTKLPAMGGSFTINPAGSGATNFLSFTAATTALSAAGVCGPVYFTIAPGTYTEKITLGVLPGVSAINTVTFDGGDSATTKITFNQTAAAGNPAVINLQGASYVTFKNLGVIATGASTCIGVSVQSSSNYNKFIKCHILVSEALTVSTCFAAGICGSTYTTPSTATYNSFENCTMRGGYLGFIMYGTSSTVFSTGNRLKSCTIVNPYYYGIYSYYQNLDSIIDNRLTMRTTATLSYGLYSYYCQNVRIERNILDKPAYMGMYVYQNNNVGSTMRMAIANNIVNMNATTPYSSQYGIQALYCGNVDIIHNTLYMANSATIYGAYISYGTNQVVKNNIFSTLSTSASSYIIYVPSNAGFTAFDHNIVYNASTTAFAYWNATYFTNLSLLKSGAAGYHANTQFKTPNFLSVVNKAEDLHLNNAVAADYGDKNFTTALDVDGEGRCSFSPTIGADESKFGSGAPVANYTTPDTIFVNSPVTLLNNNPVGSPLGHKWYIDGVYKGATWDLPYTFSATGTYAIKIVTTGCFGIDSITKFVTVYMPTQKPVANFIADFNTVETYQNVSFKDLSIKGPTYWYWTFTPSTGVNYNNLTTNTSQNPVVNFSNPGLYQVCMWDSNATGRSATACKVGYILVRSTNNLCIFPFDTKVPSGTLYDEGGPNGTYSPNATCNFLIDPCASSVNLKFTQFDVSSNSYFRIFDGSDQYGTKLYSGTGFTGATLPGGINGITANSGKMYIEFQKGTAGNGFAASWTSVAGSFAAPAGKLDLPDTMYDCGALTNVSFIPDNSLYELSGSYYRWYFDYVNNNQFPEFEGKGYSIIPYSYGSTGIYVVRCEIEGCGGSLVIMDTVIIDHPTRGPLVRLSADITTATTKDIVTLTDISKYDPIYRRWKISGPGVPTFVTGNNTTKVLGLKFTTPGYYTIQLKDSNCIASDSATFSNYIYVVDYCNPSVNLINSDFGILTTKFGRADTIINGVIPGFVYTNNNPGTVNYRDNTSQRASYQIGNSSITKYVEGLVGIGGSYNVSVKRVSNFNRANTKIWIDYNQDGTFSTTELVASSGSIAGDTYTGTISVPLTAKIGNTRMRVGTAFDNLSNEPCGPNQYGEFNDFRIRVTPDLTKPTITFTGSDVLTVEVGRTFVDPGFTVTDDVTNPCAYTKSGITSGTQITIHPSSFTYTVTAIDGAGNVSNRTRTVNSGPDVTKPVISLIGGSPAYVEVKSSYIDSSATASDFYFGNFTTFIATTSNVDVNKTGTYVVTFDVTDSSGNKANTVTRNVIVRDTQKPVISFSTADTIYFDVFSTYVAPIVTVTDNYNVGLGYTITGATVNTSVIGTYVIKYNATDSSGNIANTKTLTVIVRDTKAPTTILLVNDVVIIDVNTLSIVPEPGYSVSDNYYKASQLTVNVNYSNVKLNVIGDYIVRFYVTDPSGNLDSSKARTYRVVDRVAPVINLTGYGYILWPRWKPYTDPGNTVTDNYYTGLTCTPDISKVNVYTPGVYQVTYNVTDASGNVAKQVIRLVEVLADANGINNQVSNQLFSLYPNPGNGNINVTLNSKDTKEASITIYDANGKLVFATSQTSIINGPFQIDLSNQASGMYFINVVTNNSSTTKSFTIQK